jgi:hypothetical protein
VGATLRREIVVRQYGLLSPTNWGEDCEEELLRMNQLWNRLVEIEHATQEKYLSLISRDPAIDYIQDQISKLSAIQKSIKLDKKNIKDIDRKADALEIDNRIKELSDKLYDLRGSAIVARKAARESAGDAIRALEVKRRTEVKLARQESGLWWGNYNAVVKSYERGRQIALRNGGQMRFKRHDGTGRFTNQIQGGMTVSDLFSATHSQVRVDNLPENAWTHTSRGERRRLQRTYLTITIFVRAGERRTVTWPMIMHRPIPDDCLIKEVVVTRRKIGPSWRWQVTFTCAHLPNTQNADKKQSERPSTGRSVAVDVGWRRVAEGIRVATVLRNDNTPAKFIILPIDIVNGFALLETLQSQRDTMKNDVVTWLKSLDWTGAPEALTTYLPAIQTAEFISPARIASLALAWRSYGDWAIASYQRLEKWRLDDKRLWLWQVNQREKLLARRMDLYRRLAHEIVEGTDKVILNRLELAKMSRLFSADGAENPLSKAARRYRTFAAPAYLSRCIEMQARKIGAAVVVHDSPNWACHICGTISHPSRPADLQQTCAHCGMTWDRDLNACQVMLKIESSGQSSEDVDVLPS